MQRKTRNMGFTLIEIIVVLAILLIAALFGITSLRNFTVHSEQTARTQVARTIFMAAQTALTQKYNQDRDFDQAGHYKGTLLSADMVEQFSPSLTEKERQKAADGKLVWLYLPPNTASGALYDWLSPQINDKAILNQAILIEYNKETGRVLSAFYTEKEADGQHVTLGYGNGGYNVSNRGESALEAGFVGYFGVDSTGEPIRNNPIDPRYYDLILRDYVDYTNSGAPYGVLTAEITLPRPELRDPSFEYTLTLIPTEGREEKLTFSDADGVDTDFRLTDELMQHSSIQEAMRNPLMLGQRRIVSYYDAQEGKLVLVLDCVQSYGTYTVTENLGIRTNYPGIVGGYLDASLEISDGGDTVTLYSEDSGEPRVHALFGGVSDEGTETVYKIASVRHLNNIRNYSGQTAVFSQAADLYLDDYDHNQLNFTPLCNPTDLMRDADGAYGFTGVYQNKGYLYRIFGLHVDLSQASPMNLENAGLFDTVTQYGSVSGIRFASVSPEGRVLPVSDATKTASVLGVRNAGGIAGINQGSIVNCTVLGQITAKLETDGAAGGIAGQNLDGGTINNCYVGADVTAAKYAGGIAGASYGSIRRCEVGTASWRSSTDATNLFLTGVPYFGARNATSLQNYVQNRTSNNTFRIVIEQDNGTSGGIAGALLGQGSITDCVNAAKIEAGNETGGEGARLGGIAGGIAGHVLADDGDERTISYCYNAGAVYATDSAGGIVGRLSQGTLENSYNTGYVNREFKILTVGGATYYTPGITRNILESGAYQSGGIVGYGVGDYIAVRNCYSAQYTGNRFGGVFGVMNKRAMTTARIEKCCFLLNALNNTPQHYIESTVGGVRSLIPDASGLVRVYSSKNMRIAPSEGNLNSVAFADGTTDPGVGVFKYTYPVLHVSDGKTSYLHRTPYNPVITAFGTVKLARAGSDSAPYIVTTFTLVPPSGKLTFTVDRGNGTEFTITVPMATSNFEDLHAHVGQELYIRGEDLHSHTEYMFKIKATATDDPEAPYVYTLYLNYDRNINDNIPEDFAILTAKLYNDYYENGTRIVDQAELVASNALTLVDVTNNGKTITAHTLRIDIGPHSNGSVKITFNYEGGFQTQEVKLNQINNAPPTLEAALAAPVDEWLGFGGNDHRFPFYITGSGTSRVMFLVLWTDNDLRCTKPNGLNSVTTPVTVRAEAPNGTFVRTFEKLEP